MQDAKENDIQASPESKLSGGNDESKSREFSQETPAQPAEGLQAQPVDLTQEVNEWKQKAQEERDRVLRVLAEFENYKKRMVRQMEDYKKFANEALLKELLSVVDNLERAIVSSENTKDNPRESCVVEGVEMTLKEILRVLEKFHVSAFDALGKPFDPAFHEAVMQQESADHPENTVISVLQKGYMIHNRLLRPAMVVVSKGLPCNDGSSSHKLNQGERK